MPDERWCSATPEGVQLHVQVSPNAKKSEIVGVLDEALKIRLQAQPIDGKANDALVRYIAKVLDVPLRAVTIVRGHTSKRKLLEVALLQVTAEEVKRKLLSSSGQ